MDLTQLQPVGSSDQIKQGVLETIMSYENIQGSISVGEDTSLYKEMEDNLDLEVVNLTGTDLEDVLYFVYKDCIVVARTGTENYVLLWMPQPINRQGIWISYGFHAPWVVPLLL